LFIITSELSKVLNLVAIGRLSMSLQMEKYPTEQLINKANFESISFKNTVLFSPLTYEQSNPLVFSLLQFEILHQTKFFHTE
jgi:hypothetical protein